MPGLEDSATEHCAAGLDQLRLEADAALSPLERLPGELIYRILTSVPDLATLRSFVRSSPVIHTAYLNNRHIVLRTCLGRELDGVYVDAYANLMSRVSVLGSWRTDVRITSFLDRYKGWISGSSPCRELELMRPSGIRWMAAVQLSVIRPLALHYAGWALANLRERAGDPVASITAALAEELAALEGTAPAEPQTADDSMSRSEEIRVLRALYRYEIYHHLFGQNQGRRIGMLFRHEISELFFALFEPWEAEAVGCIDLFVRAKYEAIFNEVKADLHPRNSRFLQENGVDKPEGSFDLEAEHDDYMDGSISRGLKMTVRLLAIHDHETLVAQMQLCLTPDQCPDASLESVLSTVAQRDRREMLGVNSKDEAEQRRDSLTFPGDTVPPIGPPFAWVVLWNGKYVNVYGGYVPDSLRCWGYVMWDERRWRQMDAEGVIRKQWTFSVDLVDEIQTDYGWDPLVLGLDIEGQESQAEQP